MDNEEIKAKIRKLLALSKSPNENEAAAALEKATRLMEQYRLTGEECVRQEYVMQFAHGVKKDSFRDYLVTAMTNLYAVTAIFVTGKNWPQYQRIRFYGEPIDVFVAVEMYSYLEKTIERMARNNIRKNAKQVYRESYKTGIALGLMNRITAMGQQVSWAPERKLKQTTLIAYVRTQELDTVSSRIGENMPVNLLAKQRGMTDSETVSINRQATGASGRMIEGRNI